MAEDSPELKMVKSMLRSVLLSCKEGVQANVLLRDYQEVVAEPLPFKRLGYNSLEDFILSIPDVVRIERRGPEFIFHAVADESTAHIKALVSKQRAKRKLKPVRRPRGGGASSFAPRPYRGPPSSSTNLRPSGPRSRPGMPSFIAQQYRMPAPTPLMMVKVENNRQGARTIHVGRTQLLDRAMSDVTHERNIQDRTSSSAGFEMPPRFLKKKGEKSSPTINPAAPHISHPKRQRQKPTATFGEISDGSRYLDQFNEYMRDTGQIARFQTTQALQGYASSIILNGTVFGSEDFFKTAAEAEQAVARNAMLKLKTNMPRLQERVLPEIDWESTSYESVPDWASESCNSGTVVSALPPSQMAVVRSRVREILKNKKNGLWSTRIPFEYKEKFNEDAPDNLIELLKTWTDLARLDITPTVDRYIVFPVEEEVNENMNLVIPKEHLVRKDEEVVIYISFIYNPGYFCIQREDSTIENLTALLQSHCQSQKAINPKHLKKGMFCAGIFSGDGNWTRAEVLHFKDSETAELLFVDYGNVEKVKLSDMRWLSPELVKTPVQAITCSLVGMEPLEDETEWSTKSSILFSRHVEDKALIAIAREFYDDLVDVELRLKSDRGVNIAALLCEAGVIRDVSKEGMSLQQEVLEPDAIVLPPDKEWDVHITYISSSTNSVMLRLVGEDYSDKLDAFQNQLEKTFGTTNNASQIVEGGIYVAYDDELYHRVRSMSVENDKVLCYFLDHGDTAYLMVNQLKPLDPKINRLLPYQAIEIRLSGLEEVSTNITALEKLCDMTLGKTCVGVIFDRGEIPSLVLYDTSTDAEININQTILKTIEMEGGGIGSPRVSSPLPEHVQSPVPDGVASPVQGQASIIPDSADSHSISTSNNTNKVKDQSELMNSKTYDASQMEQNTSSVTSHSSSNSTTFSVSSVPTHIPNMGSSMIASGNTVEEDVINQLKGLAIQGGGDGGQAIQGGGNNGRAIKGDVDSGLAKQGGGDGGRAILGGGANQDSVPAELPDFIIPQPFQLPSPGSYMDVYVPFVFDPYNFVCIPYDEMDKLNSLLADMLQFYSPLQAPMDPSLIQKGFVYAGLKDEMWVRVKILDFVGTDLVSVYSVDIGEFSVMMLSELQPLSNHFAEIPMMALLCRLGTIKPKSGTWFEAAKYKFIDLARDKNLVALVQGKNEETQIVDLRLIDTSDDNVDVCIDEVLVKKGFADLI